jgi:ribosomal peptide maturation radical SAM protein 1
MTEISLVSMPLASVERPSMALGLLTAHLERAGHAVDAHHAGLWYLDYVGLEDYRLMDRSRPDDALVDWVFAGCVFPDAHEREEPYLELFERRNPRVAASLRPGWKERMTTHRRLAAGFVDWAADRILAGNPRIVGCTSTFQQHMASLALLKRIRERAPEVVTMMGGGNCESIMGRTTHQLFDWVDYVCSGEADDLIGDLMTGALRHGRDIPDGELPHAVFGPGHRTAGYPSITAGDGVPRASVQSMETMPSPVFDSYFRELEDSVLRDYIRPGLPVETSRGCWWGQVSHCTFCGLNGGNMNFRSKRPDDVVEEFQQLSKRHGVYSIEAVDNILDMNYLETVLPRLADHTPPFNLFFEIKSNLKRHQVEGLAKAGVRWVQPGVESLDSDVLALMGKGAKAWANIQLLRWCRQYGVRLSWNLISDFPGEDDRAYERMAERVPMLVHLQPGNMVVLRYDRFSPYFTRAGEFGLDLQPSTMYREVYDVDDAALNDLVYFFELKGRRRFPEPGQELPPSLAERDGARRLWHAMNAWSERWLGGRPPKLILRHQEPGAEIEDTRTSEEGTTHALDALETAVLKACDTAPPVTRFSAKLAQSLRADENEVERAVERLIALQLILEIDSRYLSLHLEDPIAPLLHLYDFPGGSLLGAPDRRVDTAA